MWVAWMIYVPSVAFVMCRFMRNDIRQSVLRQRIPYCFAEHLYPGVPRILLKEIVPDSPFTVGNSKEAKVEIIPVRVMHGKLPILGYRIGNMAWITDMLTMPESEYELLNGLDVLVMNALRPQSHSTHQNLQEALDKCKAYRAKETYLFT